MDDGQTLPSSLIIGATIRATAFRLGEMVTIDLATGEIEFGKDYTPDAAAREFWKAIGQHCPSKVAQPQSEKK